MRLHSVRLQNFRQHADTFLEFEEGLTGIIGANGTGKTTILEAIAWALYGTTAARGNRDSIKWMRAPARAVPKVELDFTLGGHRYRVVRGLTSAELFLDGAAAPIANSVTGVTEVLSRRLRMTHDEFFNTYFTGQKELSVMAAMGPTERAQFLSRILGYERLKIAQELGRERKKAIVAEATGVQSSMPNADNVRAAHAKAKEGLVAADAQAKLVQVRRAKANEAVVALTPQWEAIQAERARVQRIDADLRVAEGDETARQREMERQDRELAELATAQSELAVLQIAIEPLVAFRPELETMDRLAREEGRRKTLAEQEKELAAELGRLRDRRALIETAPRLEQDASAEMAQRKAELEAAEREHEEARTEWVKAKQEADTKVEQLRLSLIDTRKQRELLLNEGENGTCPICARPLGDHYRSVLETLDGQIESITENGDYFRKRADQLVAVPPDVVAAEAKKRGVAEAIVKLDKKLKKIHAAVQELATIDADVAGRTTKHSGIVAELATIPAGYSPERHAELKKRILELQGLESSATKLSGALERAGQLRAERDRTVTSLAVVRIRLTELRAERLTVQGIEDRFETMRVAFDLATAAQRTAEVETATAQERHASATLVADAAGRAIAELDRSVARLDELTRQRRLHEELDRAYTDLRTDLNLQLRPDISERASTLLTELTDGRYTEFELDETYNIIVHEGGLPKTVISGGEEDLANLALRVAISQMIAERAGQPLSLLILDEVFGSLDESRRNAVMDLLRRLHDRFEQVIVITHIESVRDGLDRVITVTYDEEAGASRVSQDLVTDLPDDEQLEMGAA